MNSQRHDSNSFDHGPELGVQRGGLEVDGPPPMHDPKHPVNESAPRRLATLSGSEHPRSVFSSPSQLCCSSALLSVEVSGGALVKERSKNSKVMTVTQTVTAANSANAARAVTASATSTSGPFTNLTVAAASEVSSLLLDCPYLNSPAYAATDNYYFTFTCGVAYPGGFAAYSGGTISTLAGLFAYTPQGCAVACSTFNFYSGVYGNSTVCAGMTFRSSLSIVLEAYGASC